MGSIGGIGNESSGECKDEGGVESAEGGILLWLPFWEPDAKRKEKLRGPCGQPFRTAPAQLLCSWSESSGDLLDGQARDLLGLVCHGAERFNW